ncbi:hypothetical protein ACF1A9_29150 [Streptomyces sp. NPDC014872]|uniref:hypothetical protein n=1 Tax=Streptomyces sp. NPDC014872 TaxID=3364926 RepID=UPI0036F61116
MPASELGSKIVEALNGNDYWPTRVDIPRDQDVVVGPLVFRFGGGPKHDRWYILEDPRIGPCERAGKHDYQDDPDDPDRAVCTRPGCDYAYSKKFQQ